MTQRAFSQDGDAVTLERVTVLGHAIGEAVTMPSTGASSSGKSVEAGQEPIAQIEEAARYETRSELGEGGMGVVRLCKDRRIGRHVAMKVIRGNHGSRSDARARFEREARVQGQLEHPSIVPVYDLGIADDGAAFFTMKRVRGHTLEQIVDGLRAGDPEIVARYSRRKLLSAFANVCLAVAFVHARGVLHRDIKPGNIMLGDFGEVYLLDWGLAKILGEAEEPVEELLEPSAAPNATAVGAVMGTPGYMSPEQARGDQDKLDARSDVYALGAVLFELLTLEPLIARRTPEATLAATVMGVEARASRRSPTADVAPELEEICVRATALDAAARFSTARELSEAIERYLDGDRDLERRRELADEHARRAYEAMERTTTTDAESKEARNDAIAEVSRALALDPTHRYALATMTRLVLDPPKEMPEEALAEHEASVARDRQQMARSGSRIYLSWLLAVPFVVWMGIKSWQAAALTAFFVLAASGTSYWLGRTGRVTMQTGTIVLALSSAGVASLSMLFGPLFLIPGLAATNTLVFAMHAGLGRERWRTALLGLEAVLIPLCLEWAGLLPHSLEFKDGAIVLLPRMVDFPPAATLTFLLVLGITHVVAPAFFVAQVSDAAAAAEKRAFLHAWHLRQFLPNEARAAAHVPAAPTKNQTVCHVMPRAGGTSV